MGSLGPPVKPDRARPFCAGLEIGFAQNWSIGAEYNHIFLDNHDVTLSSAFLGVDTLRIRQDVDMGLVRLNYRFGGPSSPSTDRRESTNYEGRLKSGLFCFRARMIRWRTPSPALRA